MATSQPEKSLASGAAMYRKTHPRARRRTEEAKPAGTVEAGAQLYRARRGAVIEPASEPDNLGPEAA